MPGHDANRIVGDNLVQRLAVHNRGGKWMGAKPQLSQRLTCWFHAKDPANPTRTAESRP
jgi:hypothetical protein